MNARDLLKTEGILTASPEDTVASAVGQLQSSHDAVFVFDEKKKYVGVINPYFSLIKHGSNGGDSLVKNCLYHPPRLTPEDTVERIVGLMIDSRMHFLPVMDDKHHFLGVVSARRLLDAVKDDAVFDRTVHEALQAHGKPLVSVYGEDEVSKVVNKFETEDVSKLVVIDRDMKLKGILSYHDLVPHLIAPSHLEGRPMIDQSSDELDAFAHLKVKNVAQTRVQTLPPNSTLRECLDCIVKLGIGSVVIVNREGFPSGIITVRDLLRKLGRTEEEPIIDLTTNDISPQNMDTLKMYGPHLDRWIRKMPDITRANLLVKEQKNGGLFSVKLTLIPRAGKTVMYKGEGKNLLEVLQKINKNN
jgi:CBS domain-containing protein